MSHIFSYRGLPFRVPPKTKLYWGPHRAAPEEGLPVPGLSADESLVSSRMLRDGTAQRLVVCTVNDQPADGALVITVHQDTTVAKHGRTPDGDPLAVTIEAGMSGGGHDCLDVAVPYGYMDALTIELANNSAEPSAPITEFGLCYDPPQYEG